MTSAVHATKEQMRGEIALDREMLRPLALEALLAAPTTEFRYLVNAVARLAADRGIRGPEYTAGPDRIPLSGPTLSHGDMTILQEVVWDLIVDRIVTPGADALNPQWPLLRMTERGRQTAIVELGRSA